MTYGINCTQTELRILEKNNIDFDYYDVEELFLNKNTVEIEIFNESDFEKAMKLLNRI
jgi:hypothetical protein